MKKYYLLNPGPVMISNNVRNSLLLPDICHREKEFSEILNRVRKNLNKVFKADNNFTSIVITGSGTSAMESVISSCINNKVLCLSNGAFGERWIEVVSIYNIDKVYLKYNWGEYPNLNEIEDILKKDKEIDSILAVYHETSTGIVNPIKELGELAKKYNKIFIVDAVSALAVENVNVIKDNIDICVSSSNKNIRSIPGLSFVCIKKEILNKIKKIKPKNYYLDLNKYIDYELNKSQTPTTPAIQAFYALDSALIELLKEGVDNRINTTKKYSEIIRKGVKKLKLNLLYTNNLSNGLTCVIIPKKNNFKEIHDYLKNKGFIIYAGKGELKEKIFQVSTMGNLTEEIIYTFLNALEEFLKNE